MVEFALTHDEVLTLVRSCKNLGGKWRENAIIWEIQYILLRRISEVLNLRPHDIRFDRGEICFFRTKTGTLTIRTPEFILNDLREHLNGRGGGFVFHTVSPHMTKLQHKPTIEIRRSIQSVNSDLREACRNVLGFNTDMGYKEIKHCGACDGRDGTRCSHNGMRWRNIISVKKCSREGRPTAWIRRYTIRCHALRGSAATVMSEEGIPEKNIMEAGGWKSKQSYQRYIVKRTRLDPMGIWNIVDQNIGSRLSGQTSLEKYK